MASGSVVMRSVLDVDGKSFDVVLSDSYLSWGHVGIEEFGLGKKYSSNVFIANAYTAEKVSQIIRIDTSQNCISKKRFTLCNKRYKISKTVVLNLSSECGMNSNDFRDLHSI